MPPNHLQSVKNALHGKDIRPTWHYDTVTCSEESCPSFDGKRCAAMGFAPRSICEPAVHAMMVALGTDDDREDKTWPDICTASGRGVWFLHPERTVIDPADLREHLPRVCRYNGALPWSDLQHLALCVLLARCESYASETLAYVAAHDLHEAYIGDLPTHMKRHLSGWREIEAAWEKHTHESLGLRWPLDEHVKKSVKAIDKVALCVEMDRMGHVMAEGVAQRRGVTVDDGMRSVFNTVLRLTDSERWDILVEAIPSLTKRFQ